VPQVEGEVTRGLTRPQLDTEFTCPLRSGHNQNHVDVCHPTEGSNTHGKTDIGKGRC